MSTFVPSGPVGRWQEARQLAGRVPLRIKLITAVLALVVIALAVISFASIALFRGYQLNRADQQVTALFYQARGQVSTGHGVAPGSPLYFGSYLIAMRPVGTVLTPTSPGLSLPDIPTSPAWLSANSGKLVNVPATSGTDNWRVITEQVTYRNFNLVSGTFSVQRSTLIAGVDIGDINGTIGQLAYIDLIVSGIVVVALAIAGVAIVRTSLRPLTEIEHTAQAIAAGDLSRRVPEHDPRTEVGRLGRSLNAMLAQIESAFRARAQSEASARHSEERMRRFLADASHELRTPLTAIRGYAEYYRQRGGLDNGGPDAAALDAAAPGTAAPGTLPSGTVPPGNAARDNGTAAPNEPGAEPARRATRNGGATAGPPGEPAAALPGAGPLTRVDMNRIMERVEQESSRMGGLVEDMLVLARLDQQRPVERRPVDLLTLAADAVQDARIVAPGRKIDLTVGTGAAFLVLGDEGRLRQVISNLMGNALTHTPEGTPITVRILAGHQGGDPAVPCAILEVADQGPGLTKEQASRVFERFYRADQARGRRTGGTGLGLAIVAALVAAHGGTVSLDTAPGQGATFRITLPLAPEAMAPETAD